MSIWMLLLGVAVVFLLSQAMDLYATSSRAKRRAYERGYRTGYREGLREGARLQASLPGVDLVPKKSA